MNISIYLHYLMRKNKGRNIDDTPESTFVKEVIGDEMVEMEKARIINDVVQNVSEFSAGEKSLRTSFTCLLALKVIEQWQTQ